MYLEFGNS